MRATQPIESILGTRSRVEVLRVLRGVRIPLNASQIAARTGLTSPAVTAVLRDFGDRGIVMSSSAGRANVHTLNRENVYVQRLIEPLFAAEEHLPDAMVAELAERFGAQSCSIVLFGSYARRSQSVTSDVDLVLVAPDSTAKRSLEGAAADYEPEFRERFGATLSPLVYDVAEAAALRETAPALAKAIELDAEVVSGWHPRDWRLHG